MNNLHYVAQHQKLYCVAEIVLKRDVKSSRVVGKIFFCFPVVVVFRHALEEDGKMLKNTKLVDEFVDSTLCGGVGNLKFLCNIGQRYFFGIYDKRIYGKRIYLTLKIIRVEKNFVVKFISLGVRSNFDYKKHLLRNSMLMEISGGKLIKLLRRKTVIT